MPETTIFDRLAAGDVRHPLPKATLDTGYGMAQHASAKKRIRQTKKRTEINRSRVSRIRTFLRKVETAIAGGNKEEAAAAFQLAQPELMRGVNRGAMHDNTVARKLSRLSHRIKSMTT